MPDPQQLIAMAGDIGGLKASMVSVKEEIAGVREILDDHITTTKSNFDKLAGGQQELRDILLAKRTAEDVWRTVRLMGWGLFCVVIGLVGDLFSGKAPSFKNPFH